MGVDVCVYISPADETDDGRASLIAIGQDLLAQNLVVADPREPFAVFAGKVDPLDLSSPYLFSNRVMDPEPSADGLRMEYRGLDPAELMTTAERVGPGDDLVIYLNCFNGHNPAIERMFDENQGSNADIHLVSFAKPTEIPIIDRESQDILNITRRHLFFVAGKSAIASFDGSPVESILDEHFGSERQVEVSYM